MSPKLLLKKSYVYKICIPGTTAISFFQTKTGGKSGILGLLLLTICFFIPKAELSAQVCTGAVPIITIDMRGNPDTIWTSLPTSRQLGTCCGTANRCIDFHIIPDPNVAAIVFNQITGPDPGSYDLTVNCGVTQQTVLSQICLRSDTINDLVFCKPGNNIYQYRVIGIPKPIPMADDTFRVGCPSQIRKQGLLPSSIVWNSIAPGAPGAYNSFLSCTSGCPIDTFNPTSVPPGGYIDYLVTGTPAASSCLGNLTQYDTVRFYVYAQLTVAITPNPASFCPSSGGVTLTATPTGGFGTYKYSWSPVTATTATYFATSAGTYSVTLMDGLSTKCPNAATSIPVTVTSISSTPTHNDISCFGANNGTATATPSGGTPPYNYAWSNGQTNSTATGLAPGTYSVLITGGCTTTNSYTITQPTVLAASVTGSTNVTCHGNSNGTINTSISGGSPGYTILWSPSGQTTQNISGIGPGTYTMTVTDTHGCTKTATQVITQPPALTPLPGTVGTVTDLTCHGNSTGMVAVDVLALGGTPSYTFVWSNGATTATVVGLPAGTISVTIIDANGCTADSTFLVSEPDTITTSVDNFSSYPGGYNIKCHGGSDGSVHVLATGGTAPYIYSWNTTPVQTTATATGLPAGTYIVTVKDQNNCTVAHNNVVITEPDSLIADLTAKLYAGGYNIACKGENSGYIFTDVLGGVPSYTYSWLTSPTAPEPNDSDLVKKYAGFYKVQVTDINGCTAIDTITLTEPATVVPLITSITYTNVNVSCFGNCDGGISVVSITGGTPAYSYLWNNDPTQTTAIISGLCVSENLIHINDDNGCVFDSLITLIGPAIINVTAFDSANVTCHGYANGFISPVTVIGGVGGYTYSWNTTPAQTTSSISGLSDGSYCLTVTDLNACQQTFCVDLTQPDTIDVIANSTNVLCNSGSSGTADVSVTGGTGSYTYLWSNGATTAAVTNLAVGTYSVHITDANGCFSDKMFNIIEPTTLKIDSLVADVYPGGWNISCHGGEDGNVHSFISGGTLGYTYLWNYGYTTASITGVSLVTAPPYALTVTDANGCTAVDSILLTEPPAVVSTALSVIPVFCFGDTTGSITVGTTGGTGPFLYYLGSVSPGNLRSNPITGLTLGTYTIITVDLNGCMDSTLVVPITSPPGGINATVNSNVPSCASINTGVLSVNATGGSPPYAYSWNSTPAQTTATATGLSPGTYTVLVTDSLGCSFQIAGIVLNPSTFLAAVSFKEVSCKNSPTGYATATPTGGTAPYTYSWNNGQTTATATGLIAGTYSVLVKDSLGCDTLLFTTINPNTLLASVTATGLACKSSPTGYATATPTGGSGAYTYLWNNGQTNATATGLGAGTYSVQVTDSLGCDTTLFATINLNTLQATVTATGLTCKSSTTGYATATPTGGSGAYTYLWNNGQTNATATNLGAGTYSVLVTDSIGCDTTLFATINLNTLQATVTATGLTCKGSPTGFATATPTGGSGAYTYSWSNGQSNATATGLSAGTYSVHISDSIGCDTTLIATINPNTLLASVTATGLTCKGTPTGYATATPTGGSGSYTYSWSNGQTNATATGLGAGTYSVHIADGIGCDTTLLATINPNTLLANITATELTCKGAPTGYATATPTGGSGAYTFSWSNGQTNATATGLGAGTYSVHITDSIGCDTTLFATINSNTLLASITSQNVSCKNINTGTATATPTGGSGAYTYLWNVGQSAATATGLQPGTYSVLINDSLGCDTTLFVTIGQNTLTVTDTIADPISCSNKNSGKAAAIATGGTQPYTYQWSHGPTTALVTGLSPGTYSVIVTDSMGCTDTIPSIIIGQNILSVTASATQVSCKNVDSGKAIALPSGGTQPYTYLWNDLNNQTTQEATGLPSGTYSVIVTDSIGCADTVQAVIINKNTLTATLSSTKPSCTYVNNGTAKVTTTGGTQPYTYSWSNGQSADSAVGLSPNIIYTVVVMDSVGCTDTIPTVFVDSNVVAAAAGTDTIMCIQEFTKSGHFDLVAVNPATGVGTWMIKSGLNSSLTSTTSLSTQLTVSPVDTGSHVVLWVVQNGDCYDTATVKLGISHAGKCLDLELPNGFSPNNDGSNDDYVIVGIERYPVNSFRVFNRWGNLVFSKDNYVNHDSSRNWWGQNNNGEKLPDGTYYVILVTDNGNIKRNTYVDLRR